MNLALFDFDGTITSKDTFTPFIYFAVSRRRIALGTLALSPMILGYKLGLCSTPKMRAGIIRVGFTGQPEAQVNKLGCVYSKHTLPTVMRPEALERIRWHKQQGDKVVVVSASLGAYLRDWCAELELDLICSELEARNGILTGRYAGGDCTGSEKSRRVLARYDLSQFPVVYAYGDTAEDRSLLALANKRYFRWQELPI
jgi:HAD superfamily hydrolase (TIGR01490 family)